MQPDNSQANPVEIGREVRFWLRNRATLERIVSTRLDFFAVWSRHALAIDFKSGFKNLTPSEVSWQLRVQALALWHNYPDITHVRAGFAHSRLSSRLDTCDYDLTDLARIECELLHVLWKIEQPGAERVPGSHCRYCKAQGVCREAATYSLVAASRAPVIPGTMKPDELAICAAVGRMQPEEMAFVFKRKQIANAVFDAVEARLKTLPKEVLNPLGYDLAPGNKNKEITDVATAFHRLSELLTDAERVQCIKLTVGKASEILAGRLKVSKKKASESVLEALGDTVREKIGEPRLKAI